ncbi:MAG: HYR domain-containing protein [Saprospirales bacterium]|nr:HYR domain-containing protein [Saprospirales bacterium]
MEIPWWPATPPIRSGCAGAGVYTVKATFDAVAASEWVFVHNQDFEDPGYTMGGNDWNDFGSSVTRVTSGTAGITSADGAAHAALEPNPGYQNGAFTRLGGYRFLLRKWFPNLLDVYMDLSDPAVADNTYGWDLSSAVSNTSGSHRRDFIFHTAGYSGGQILVGADNNTNYARRGDLGSINHYTITASGWYTFEWLFYDGGAGQLYVDLNLRDASGTLLWTETRTDASDIIGSTVGGNRYMWFTFAKTDYLPIDNTTLEYNKEIYPGCSQMVSQQVTVVPNPQIFAVTGGAAVADCANNNDGIVVGLEDSELNTTYELFLNGGSTGLTTPGTGNAINFPTQYVAGTYTIKAYNDNSPNPPVCMSDMSGSAVLTLNGAPNACNASLQVCPNDFDGNVGTFDLTLADDAIACQVGGMTVTYHLSMSDAEDDVNAIGTPNSYDSETIDLWARVENADGCFALALLHLEIYESPAILVTGEDASCPGAADGSVTVQVLSGPLSYTYSWEDASNTPIGSGATVSGLGAGTYYVTVGDGNGCTAEGSVTIGDSDGEAPIAVCQDFTVYLDENGAASIMAADVDGGSYDNCDVSLTLALSIYSFTCDDTGENFVTLTVTDDAGNSAICVATVTVVDDMDPTIVCPTTVPIEVLTSNTDGACEAVVTFDDPLVDDNCELILFNSGQEIFGYSGTIETWTVPAGVTSISIEARGAEGGFHTASTVAPGQGAIVSGEFAVVPGQQLKILVGQKPANGNGNGGGGGSFVTDIADNPLIIAGGGAGSTGEVSNPNKDGQLGTAGGDGLSGGGTGGINGNGGNAGLNFYQSGAGGGLLTDGANGTVPFGIGGLSFLNGGAGGFSTNYPSASGGFGGGASGSLYVVGGGGGGYSGGGSGSNSAGPATSGGGGGSFNAGASPTFALGNTGNGLIIITYEVGTATLVQTEGLPSGSLFPIGTTTNTFVITDNSGNTASCSFDVVVTDDELPLIDCPGNVAISTSNLNSEGDCAGQYECTHPTPSDNCGIENYAVSYANPDGVFDGPYDVSPYDAVLNDLPTGNRDFEVGVSTVQYYVIDASGNSATCSFTVTVTDNEPPTFVNCPSDILVNNDVDKCEAVVWWATPIADDNCGATVSLVAPSPNPGSPFNVGPATAISYKATDAAGNSAYCNFTVTVVDMQLPEIECQSPLTVGTNDACQYTVADGTFDAAYSDNCSGASAVHNYGSAPDNTTLAGASFNTGTTVVVWTVTDASPSSMTATCSQVIIVTDDDAPTVASCPSDATIYADGDCLGTLDYTLPTFNDNCDGTGLHGTLVSGLAPSASPSFPLGTTIVRYEYTDAAGNGPAYCEFEVTVIDNTSPAISCPDDIVVSINGDGTASISAGLANLGAQGPCGVTLSYTAPVGTDNCSAQTFLTSGLGAGPNYYQYGGTYTEAYLVVDGAGLTDNCNFTITIEDATAPAITCPDDFTVDTDPGVCEAEVVYGGILFSDNCPGYTISTTGPL